MRVHDLPTSEARNLENELESIASPLPTYGDHANDTTLEVEDGESNSWVENLLHESSSETLSLGAVKLDPARRVAISDGHHVRFAPLDFALLLVLARNLGRMLSYARIARQVWGPNLKISVARLRVRVFRVRQRLEEERMYGIRIVNRGGLGYVMELDGRMGRHTRERKELGGRSGVPTAVTPAALPIGDTRIRRDVATAAE